MSLIRTIKEDDNVPVVDEEEEDELEAHNSGKVPRFVSFMQYLITKTSEKKNLILWNSILKLSPP